MERIIRENHLQHRVEIPGIISEIGSEYERAEAFVIPSRYESFGLVTAEAMSYGLPVIGFADCPGTNELIEAGKTGVLVEPDGGRVESLASALSMLMADPELRQRLGSAGHEVVSRRYSKSYVGGLWEELLISLGAGATTSSASLEEIP